MDRALKEPYLALLQVALTIAAKITGSVLPVHPLLILVLLLVGERFFGIWGLVVGVPIGESNPRSLG